MSGWDDIREREEREKRESGQRLSPASSHSPTGDGPFFDKEGNRLTQEQRKKLSDERVARGLPPFRSNVGQHAASGGEPSSGRRGESTYGLSTTRPPESHAGLPPDGGEGFLKSSPPYVDYRGERYYTTGKVGRSLSSGKMSAEYENEDAARVWRDSDGKVAPE